MTDRVQAEAYNPYKHQAVSVPLHVHSARIELLRSRGAPVYIGTELALLYLPHEVITLHSKVSGVVNRVLVDENQIVLAGQDLFELRSPNIHRDKSGHKMEPANYPRPKPLFYSTGKTFSFNKDVTPSNLVLTACPIQSIQLYPKFFKLEPQPFKNTSNRSKVDQSGIVSTKEILR